MANKPILVGVSVLALSISQAALATPVACAGGGTLDIQTTSDTQLTGTAYNVGQKAILTAVTTGPAATTHAWTIPGPQIKDYVDSLGTKLIINPNSPPANAIPWSTTTLSAADLAQAALSFYWKPSAAQIHPLNGPPETRTISLTATVGGSACTATATVTVERNLTDANRQPEDYYTSTHRAATTTNPGFGGVVDEHIYWHQFVGTGPSGGWSQFLPWHTYFLRRFDEWRQEFGYPAVAAWYPGRPLPTGPEFDQTPSLRLAFNPNNNRLPTQFTLAGGTNPAKLADFASVNSLTSAFEGGFHGTVHCNIGANIGGFFATSGPGFGSMCVASSPKDPMFWRWHGFIDKLYRNYCAIKGIACHFTPEPAANIWMGDNAADVAAGGVPPSPGPRWMSPDIWNRTAELTDDACMPRPTPPNLQTVGGAQRNCGSEADHENPVAGSPNFLYATIRNTGASAQRNVYAEVVVYIANASTGLSWPADFTILPESRQFIELNLAPGQVTAIGPLPWTPPNPTPSDHWCLYIRVLSVQEAPLVEGPVVDTNVANSNSIAWRNLKIVALGQKKVQSKFIVRNIRKGEQRLALDLAIPPELLRGGTVALRLDPLLQRALKAGNVETRGVTVLRDGTFAVSEPKATIAGFRLPPRGQGAIDLSLVSPAGFRTTGDIVVTQRSAEGIDGGVTLRVGKPRRR